MKRLASEQKIITLTWDSETKKSAILSQAVRFVLYFLFFTQPIGIIILGMQTDHHWLVYFFGLGAYIPTCWYVLATLKKMPRQIEKRMFQNISKTLPPSLKTMTSEILGAFNIKQELLEYWINSRAFGVSPAVISYGRKYHVILPLGFVKLLGTDEIEARQILAHEFSHIRQKDTDLLILVKLFIRAAVFFILPMLLINFIFSVYINIGNNLDARRDVDSFRSSFVIGGVDFDRVLKAEEDLEMNNRETIRNVVLLLIIIPGSLFLLRGVKK